MANLIDITQNILTQIPSYKKITIHTNLDIFTNLLVEIFPALKDKYSIQISSDIFDKCPIVHRIIQDHNAFCLENEIIDYSIQDMYYYSLDELYIVERTTNTDAKLQDAAISLLCDYMMPEYQELNEDIIRKYIEDEQKKIKKAINRIKKYYPPKIKNAQAE